MHIHDSANLFAHFAAKYNMIIPAQLCKSAMWSKYVPSKSPGAYSHVTSLVSHFNVIHHTVGLLAQLASAATM